MAADPFGLGVSDGWRKSIRREFEASKPLRDYVERLVDRSLDSQAETLRQVAGDLRTKATRELDDRFSLGVRDLTQYEELLALQTACEEAGLHGATYPQHRISDLLTAVRRVVEGTLRVVAKDHPVDRAWQRLYRGRDPIQDRGYCRSVYEGTARELGLKVPLPEALASVKPNIVKSASYPNSVTVRGHIMASLLAARDDVSHPFRTLAPLHPDLLEELDAILNACNPAAHAGSAHIASEDALAVAESAFRLVGALSGLAMPSPPNEGVTT